MQRASRRQRVRAGLVAMVLSTGAAVTVTAPEATAAAPGGRVEEHCVVRVVGVDASGMLRTTAPACAPTRAAAFEASGASATSTWVIGYHYDGFDLTGSSFQVVGDSCIGGWLNLPAVWVNRVSSTLHGCGHIRHFDGFDLTGASQLTVAPGGNLSTLNNRTNSIQYLA